MNYYDYDEIPDEEFSIDNLFFYSNQPYPTDENLGGKIPVRLCCEFTVNIFEKLRPLSPSKEEFKFFLQSFRDHRTAKDYSLKKDLSYDVTLDKIFNRARRLKPALGVFYLSNMKEDIIFQLEHREEMKMDFQANFEIRMQEQGIMDNAAQLISSLRLNTNIRGAKTNLLRVLDALWMLQYFKDENGTSLSRNKLMEAFGRLLNEDFSSSESSLSQAYNYTKIESNLAIFDEMKAVIQEKCFPK